VKIDRGSEIPIHKQIANQLRDSILSGELPAGRRIPSKRDITQELNIAGSTVDKATAILKDEGLIRGSQGLGLFVVPENEWPKPKKSR
jgi:DNA-binding GntR family transcriptional regulator